MSNLGLGYMLVIIGSGLYVLISAIEVLISKLSI